MEGDGADEVVAGKALGSCGIVGGATVKAALAASEWAGGG